MRWIASFFIVGALLVVLGSAAVFFIALGKLPAQINANDWSLFGAYFGGVAGPLLAFVTVMGLAFTLLMQNRQIEQVSENNLKDQHVRMLIEIGHDLNAIEDQHLDADVTLRNILNGSKDLPPASTGAFKAALQQYTKMLGHYAQGVELYRENISAHFDCRAFEQRGLRLLDRIEPYASHLDSMGKIALTIIKGHLEGTLIKRDN